MATVGKSTRCVSSKAIPNSQLRRSARRNQCASTAFPQPEPLARPSLQRESPQSGSKKCCLSHNEADQNHQRKRQKKSPSRSDGQKSVQEWLETLPASKLCIEMNPHPEISILARPRSLSRKRSVGGSPRNSVASDRTTNNEKNDDYSSRRFVELLATKDCHLEVDPYEPIVPCDQELDMIISLLDKQPPVPQETRFSDREFRNTFANMANQSKARVVRDIGENVFPSPSYLFSQGRIDVKELQDIVNEKWIQAIPILLDKPYPDISVGFKRNAFTREQISKLEPYIGSESEDSFFAATMAVWFMFMADEVKGPNSLLDIADRQNAVSMFIAVRSIVKLYELVGRDLRELNGKILAFSVSHNDREVRIYGYFPFTETTTTYHRHEIKQILLKADNGKERWTSYKFVASVYQHWVPKHLQLIRALIDELPSDGIG